MLNTEELHTLLDERRQKLGLSHMQLGKLAFDREDASGLHNLKRGSSPTYERLCKLAKALGLEVYVGEPRDLAADYPTTTTILAPRLDPGWHKIPWHRLMGRGGPGPMAFEASWLDERGVDAERLSAIEVDGQLALIMEYRFDESVRPDTWATYRNGEISIERIQRGRDAILIFPSGGGEVKVLTGKGMNEINLLGRVVWLTSPTF